MPRLLSSLCQSNQKSRSERNKMHGCGKFCGVPAVAFCISPPDLLNFWYPMEARLMIHLSCPHCQTELRTGNGRGKVARCPNCLTLIELPKPVGPSAPLPDAQKPAARLSATTAFPSPPKRASDPLDLPRPQVQQKRNF